MKFGKGHIVIFAERARRHVPDLVGKRAQVMNTNLIEWEDVDVMMLEDASVVTKRGARLTVDPEWLDMAPEAK